jgi:hypothetical protein
MNKYLFLISVFVVTAFGIELPVTPTTKVVIKKGQFSTVSFPFDITHIEKSPFLSRVTLPSDIKADAIIDTEALLNANSLPQPKKAGARKAPKSTSIRMKKSKRSLSFYPLKLGSTELVVYGNGKFPMHVHIIVKNKAGADHFVFRNFGKNNRLDTEKSSHFEMVPHEKVISKLIKYVYNNKIPKGFSQSYVSKTYNRKGMRFKLRKKLVGNKYQVNEWIVKNTAPGKVTLYEEMFYLDGVYSITFENNILKKGESTRMFVVQRTGRS